MKTIEMLQAEKSKVDLEISQCKAAIREMTADVREKRRFAPVKQYNDMQIKVRRLGQTSQNIQHEIASINRARKEASRRAISECFVTVSKSVLPQEKFLALLSMAHEMAETATSDKSNAEFSGAAQLHRAASAGTPS